MKIAHIKETEEILQLKISLKNAKPPIWRRILIEKEFSFEDLHNVIQDVMGWGNAHLYEFSDPNIRIGEIFEHDNDDFFDNVKSDSATIAIGDYFQRLKQKITYTYDFGDSWDHQIIVEKFLKKDNNIDYPMCIKGKNNCPPEDCGGIWGFYNMLEIIQDENNPENKETIAWIGEDYDFEYFNLEETNERLH